MLIVCKHPPVYDFKVSFDFLLIVRADTDREYDSAYGSDISGCQSLGCKLRQGLVDGRCATAFPSPCLPPLTITVENLAQLVVWREHGKQSPLGTVLPGLLTEGVVAIFHDIAWIGVAQCIAFRRASILAPRFHARFDAFLGIIQCILKDGKDRHMVTSV